MKKTVLHFLSVLLLVVLSSSILLIAACGEEEFNPEITNEFSINGFTFKTVQGLVEEHTHTNDGFSLIPETGKPDCQIHGISGSFVDGNSAYDFENKTLDSFTADIEKLINVRVLNQYVDNTTNLQNFTTIQCTQTKADGYSKKIDFRKYLINVNNRISGLDGKGFLYTAKLENNFVYILCEVFAYKNININNFFKIADRTIETLSIQEPIKNRTYDNSIKPLIAQETSSSGILLGDCNYTINYPSNFNKFLNFIRMSSNECGAYISIERRSGGGMRQQGDEWYGYGPFPYKIYNIVLNANSGDILIGGVKDSNNNWDFYLLKLQDNRLLMDIIWASVSVDAEYQHLGVENYCEETLFEIIKTISVIE